MSELAQSMNQAVKAMTIKTGKYLTFTLDDETYGIGILKVKEIIGRAKEAVGNATDNPKLKAEGEVEQSEGKIQQIAGNVKEAVEDVGEAIKHAFKKD